ncbi:hypothetical protein F383_30481 [Gossypium arboreum]|uniref:Uncharacterized protein n=1 Tax=Gossypium arboreum TaxID=29729 RepID=A0A0B0PGM6_GOSAR|nr:hypothetical protein F383_30481 [Gossypium arboreum]
MYISNGASELVELSPSL